MFKKKGIDVKKLFFIDAISGAIGEKSTAGNCQIVQNPSALTELSIQITNACVTKKPSFFIMDSLSTMLVYNNENATIRFIHYLTVQLRKSKIAGVIFCLKKTWKRKC